jgi:hypothetical protein
MTFSSEALVVLVISLIFDVHHFRTILVLSTTAPSSSSLSPSNHLLELPLVFWVVVIVLVISRGDIFLGREVLLLLSSFIFFQL